MEPIQDNYPIFEANQVLSNSHLNQVFNYLDEQERLTRANLIGIGIVCGLALRLETTPSVTIHLSKGCGITSEGYLIIESNDTALVSYREYTLPKALDYPPFKDESPDHEQYSLWELFPAGEPDTTPLGTPAGFLNDKAVVLFLELKEESLRNCSPNNCDDKGSEVTATVRRLLVKIDDLTKIIAEANTLETNLTFADLETALLARLNLPDLRLPRYDVPNTSPATSNEILAAFLAVFQTEKLALYTGNALTAAYNAFKPVVQGMYPSDPFVSFSAKFGFLDNAPTTTTQVRFLQYYYDLFDDLLRAYDEFRWKGVELMCACCPPEELFPRHLMLGVLFPASVPTPDIYRHHFLTSSAVGSCEERTKELEQLFQRMVAMIDNFTNTPTLPTPSPNSNTDTQIRFTPSILGDKPLSDKAIPYYYGQTGAPPLFQLWNFERTRRNRANQNLSYRSDEYTPTAPAFVTNALHYDIEPHNFLRIEGHLGKNYRSVLNTLLAMKTQFRLPIEIIALRTGTFDEEIPVDLSKEECTFQDLEALYDTLKAELSCFLCKEVQYFYNLPQEVDSQITTPVKPTLPLLTQCAPDFLVQPRTLGRSYEDWLKTLPGGVIPDIDPNIIIYLLNLPIVGQSNGIIFHVITYLSKLSDQLSQDLRHFNFVDFEKRFHDLVIVTEAIEHEREQSTDNIEGNTNLLNWEELDDRLEDIIYHCRLDAFRALQDEYKRRVREVKQKQFLSFFLQQNPGIQHKAGVPLGGTFIIAYHDEPAPLKEGLDIDKIRDSLSPATPIFGKAEVDTIAVAKAFQRISAKPQFALDSDISFLLGTFTGQVPDLNIVLPPAGGDEADEIIEATVNELANGTVIADFFLPYLCCSVCAPVQYTLPLPPLGLTLQLGCTDPNGSAEATLTPQGGMAPFTYQLDNQSFQALTGKLVLTVGAHTLVIRDSAGAESASQSLTVPAPLTIGAETFIDNVEAKTYQVSFTISDGTAPYSADGTVTGSTFTSAPVNSGETMRVTITDSVGCTAARDFQHTVEPPCDLPCEGQSRRCAYRLWVQPPLDGASYETYKQESNIKFRFDGTEINLPGIPDLLNVNSSQLNQNFHDVIGSIIKTLNKVLNQALDENEKFGHLSKPLLVITYEPNQNDPFGILWIEHFVCQTFNIEFDFLYAKPTPAFRLTIRYTNEKDDTGTAFDGVILINRELNNKETRVPAFDCSEHNQCTDSDYKKLCEDPDPKPEFSVKQLGDNKFQFTGDGGSIPKDEIAAWVWDAFLAQPGEPFYEGNKVEAQLQKPGGPVKLTVITKKGCFGVIQHKNIDQ